MNRILLLTVLCLTGCFEPVDVGMHDAGLPCVIGVDQTCNELETMSALAGSCSVTGCTCVAGFERGPTGRCRPVNACPSTPQQPGLACTAAGLTCRYGYQPPECGGRTVRCEASTWVQVEKTEPQPSCSADAGTCVGSAPLCLMGTVGGLCGDGATVPLCQGSTWVCPQGTIPSTQCACSGLRPGCDCTAQGWSCSDAGVSCTPGLAMSCNDGPVDGGVGGVAGTCSVTGTCTCAAGFERNPATGRCRAAATCVGFGPMCVAGTVGGLCGDGATAPVCQASAWVCPQGTIPSTQCACSGLRPGCTCTAQGWSCGDAGTSCTPGLAMSCNDGSVDGGVGGVAGTCSATGTCTCVAGFELNPATGRCRAVVAASCTGNGNDQACNELQQMASFAGQCVSGRCVCNAGFEFAPTGRCQPIGATCTDRVPLSCNDGPVDGGVGGLAGTCVVGGCVCNAGFELNPANGRCRASSPPPTCTVGMDQTCNANAGMSSLAGACVAGSCVCNPGFVLTSAGKCTAAAGGYCVVTTGAGQCSIVSLDGGVAANGFCGSQNTFPGCTCSGSPPTFTCLEVCPPNPGTTCVTTNCGSINCLPPLRCTGTNICTP